MEFNAPAELGWKALKYAARRLPDGDCAAFEEQLSEDQTAREAVAQAVELSHTVAALHAGEPDATISAELICLLPVEENIAVAFPPSGVTRWSWQQAAGWMSLGVAACLAVVLASSHWFAANSSADLAAANELVTANWVDLQNSGLPTETALPGDFVAANGAMADEKDRAAASDESETVPDWLVLGVEKDLN